MWHYGVWHYGAWHYRAWHYSVWHYGTCPQHDQWGGVNPPMGGCGLTNVRSGPEGVWPWLVRILTPIVNVKFVILLHPSKITVINMKWQSILWRNHLAGFDDTFFKCSICNKTVGQCQICYSASSLKNPWQSMKWKSILWRNHLAGFDNTFFNVQYVTNQLVSVKFVFIKSK